MAQPLIYGGSVDSVASQEANKNRELIDSYKFNIGGMERAAQQATQYAYQNRQLQAADAAAETNYFNQFNREVALNRDQQAREREAIGMRRYEMGANQKNLDRQFGLQERQLKMQEDKDATLTGRAATVGPVLADALRSIAEQRDAAEKEVAAAQSSINSVLSLASGRGLYDLNKKEWKSSGPEITPYSDRLRASTTALKSAQDKMKYASSEMERAERQAMANRLSIGSDGVRSLDTGNLYPFGETARPGGAPSAAPSSVNYVYRNGRLIRADGASEELNPSSAIPEQFAPPASLAPRPSAQLRPLRPSQPDRGPVESTGVGPAIARAGTEAARLLWNGFTWVYDKTPNPSQAYRMKRKSEEAAGDFFYTPPADSEEYKNLMRERAAADAAAAKNYNWWDAPKPITY